MKGCIKNMEREILFRGKKMGSDAWAYGDLINGVADQKGMAFIWQEENNKPFNTREYNVIPETVGQYTGLTDKNGIKIFEGDIVKGTYFGFPLPVYNYTLEISWQEAIAGWGANYFENVEVIGNIHDNPELLKGGAE